MRRKRNAAGVPLVLDRDNNLSAGSSYKNDDLLTYVPLHFVPLGGFKSVYPP